MEQSADTMRRWLVDWGIDGAGGPLPPLVHPSAAPRVMPGALTQTLSVVTPPPNFGDARLAHLQDLPSLRQALENFHACDLKETALHTVFGDGNPEASVMLVGEAPGAEEDRVGRPFVGASGQLLDKILASIGLDRTSVYIANIVPWRPPGNRTPSISEIALCLPFLERHISLIQPQKIVLLGGTAAKALLATDTGVMRLRGHWFPYKNPYLSEPIPTLVTFHPAYLLRSPGQKRGSWEDFLRLKCAL